jgi:hypothetical protein
VLVIMVTTGFSFLLETEKLTADRDRPEPETSPLPVRDPVYLDPVLSQLADLFAKRSATNY